MIKKNLFSAKELILRCISFLSAFIFLSIATSSHAQTPSHNKDPLSLSEVSNASFLMTGPKLAARASVVTSADVIPSTNSTQEILLIERNEEKGAPSDQRRADVYMYDYSTNELIHSLIDLNTSELIQSERKQGVQLPLTKNELARAKQIIFDDEDERAILEDEYRRISSSEMTDISDINIKAFTFLAESLPNRVNEASKQCGIHRCAQLMLFTQENIVFEISPIVNLSEGVVTQRIGF